MKHVTKPFEKDFTEDIIGEHNFSMGTVMLLDVNKDLR